MARRRATASRSQADAERHAAERAEDRRLVEATLGGDNGAFEVLFTRYREKVYGVVYGYVRNRDDALDIVQDAFVKAFQRLSTFRLEAKFYTWITQIAINLSIDHTRRRKRRKVIELQEHHEPDKTLASSTPPRAPGAGMLDDEFRERYEEALAKLSEKHQAVFVMHAIKGTSYKEIADVLGISIGTVMSRLHYARKNLQKHLADYLT
ncbi:MAG: RNA polymerase sigma factor [Planctomycetota bacterium]